MENRGLTRTELSVAVVAVALLAAGLALWTCRRVPTDASIFRCRNMLGQLARGMHVYIEALGDNRWCPFPLAQDRRPIGYNGAEWLASLYWSGTGTWSRAFLCPSSDDTNHGGRDLGTRLGASATFGPQTVSYAGLHYRSLTGAAGAPRAAAIPHDFPPNMPMACDDTQGSINHGERDNGGMNILFFDGHVELRTNTDVDLERGVGRKGGLLWQLRN